MTDGVSFYIFIASIVAFAFFIIWIASGGVQRLFKRYDRFMDKMDGNHWDG